MNPAREAFKPRGMATGIGSLPHVDPAAAVSAVLAALPECPFWPQLPKLGPQEGMTLQYAANFPGLRHDKGSLFIDTGDEGRAELVAFFEQVLGGDEAAFGLPEERSKGFPAFLAALDAGSGASAKYLKCHVTGPVTLASALKDAKGREITFDAEFCEAVSMLLAANARWQMERLARYGKPLIVFIDEPVMEVYGSAYSPLDEATVRGLWQPLLEAVLEAGALSGIHVCGNTDWSLLFDSGADIVNFDAYHFLDRLTLYPKEAKRFLEEGGVLAWGVVPTSEKAEGESAEGLLERIEEGMRRFEEGGIPRELLVERALITPSCGMGGLDEPLTARILGLLAETSRLFKEKYKV